MESTLVRQAIRAAVALAVASAHGQTPEDIAELRDEATQLIGLCVYPPAAPEELRIWCDGATTLVSRLTSSGNFPQEQVLYASAAVLRLRLAAARAASVTSAKKTKSQPAEKPAPKAEPKPIELTENQQKVVDHITEHPGVRTNGIVDGLSGALSPRTVKRMLSELIALRVIHRSALPDGGASFRVETKTAHP